MVHIVTHMGNLIGGAMQINGIDKFNDLFKKRQYDNLSGDDKNKFIRHILIELLKDNPNGITANQLEMFLPFDVKTIRKHLEYLTAIRESYSIQIGRTYVYYPNGKLARFANFEDIEIGSKYYSFFDIKNQYGNFVYLQEKEKDVYNTFKVTGGLLVEKEKVADFISRLDMFLNKISSREVELNE